MKKLKLSFVSLALAGSLLLTSCIGSFALTNSVLDWNKNLTNSPFANELVFIILHFIPGYEVSYFVDLAVLNSVEFWSGENPMTAQTVKKVKGEHGNYIVRSSKRGHTISKEGEKGVLEVVYNDEAQSWDVVKDDQHYQLFRVNADGTYAVNVNGTQVCVTPDALGLMVARQFVDSKCVLATR